VDCDTFRKQNTVPLFPGKVQRWVLARTDKDGANESLVRADVERALESLGGSYGNVVVKRVSRSLVMPVAPVVKRREQLTVLPLLSGQKPWYVEVEFDYHGSVETIAWPIVGPVASFSGCDTNALDWALLSVGGPLKDAEHQKGPGEYIDQAEEAVKETAREIGKGLLAGAVAIGIAWVIARKL
jgi:hypothetical protein